MAEHDLVAAVRQRWAALAGEGARFPAAPGVHVLATTASRLCPAGWCGVVSVSGAALATAPDAEQARQLTAALLGLADDARTDPSVVRAVLPVTEVLGPARLAYLPTRPTRPGRPGRSGLRPDVVAPEGARLEVVAPDDARLTELLAACAPEEVAESGMPAAGSPAVLLVEGGEVLAAAGYDRWPGDVAHLCVLTRPDARGGRRASAVAARATAHALDRGLLPQWRARPEASLRLATALGYRVLGSQLSLRLRGSR